MRVRCGFRRAVACAHELTKRDLRIGFMGPPVDTDPAVDIGVRRGNTVHGVVTTLPPRQYRSIVE